MGLVVLDSMQRGSVMGWERAMGSRWETAMGWGLAASGWESCCWLLHEHGCLHSCGRPLGLCLSSLY